MSEELQKEVEDRLRLFAQQYSFAGSVNRQQGITCDAMDANDEFVRKVSANIIELIRGAGEQPAIAQDPTPNAQEG